MAYKPRRELRYRALLYVGCPKWEAMPLSRIPYTKKRVPYMQAFIDARNEEYERAIRWAKRKGMGEKEFDRWWATHIKRKYIALGLKHKSERWGATVAYRMLKLFERRYRDKKPEYESPWEGRRRKFKDFQRKIEREYPVAVSMRRGVADLRGATGDRWVG